MIVRVINGFYDADKRRIIEKDELANYDDNRAKELIALKLVIAEEVTAGEIDENGNFIVDGDVIGHTEGEDITITDSDVIDDTLKSMAEETKEKSEAEAKKSK